MRTGTRLIAKAMLLAAAGTALGQPAITTQPQDQTNYVGTTATFTVFAAGMEPLNYQWQDFTTCWQNMAERTNAVLTLTNVQINDAKDYRVVVTDATGTTNSETAHLYIRTPATLLISSTSPGVVTLSWQGSMVLLEAITRDSGSLDCAAWFRVGDTSPVTLPVRSSGLFFRLVALPSVAELQAAFQTNLVRCLLKDCKACEDCVNVYFLLGQTGALESNYEAEEAASMGMELGSCISPIQAQVLNGLKWGVQPEP